MRTTAQLVRTVPLWLLTVAVPVWCSSLAGAVYAVTPVSRILLPAGLAAAPAQAWNRDPLTEQEADQLRETAAEPDKRLFLLAEFATARMAKVEEARAQTKPAATHGQRIHDALEEFGRVMDEIDDNIDDYESRKMEMRKGLSRLIETDTVFQSKLAEMQLSAAGSASAEDYRFVLQDAIDIVNGQLQLAREVLQEQERRAAEEKEKERQKKKQQARPDRDYQQR